MNLGTKAAVGLGAGVVALGVLWWAKGRFPAAAQTVLTAVNPLNRDNVFAKGADAVWAQITGDPDQTPGGSIFDVLNPRAGIAANETVNADGTISVLTVQQALPAAGMGDDNAWWYGGGYAETTGGAVTGIVRKP